MQLRQEPRVATNPFAVRGSKFFLCLFLVPALLICANAETSSGGTTGGNKITIYPSQLPIASVSVPYSARVSLSGGTAPYQFVFLRGTIPPGLYFDTTTGTVAGTPTAAGTFSFILNVTDLGNANRGELTVYVVVNGGNGINVTVTPNSASVSPS